MRHLGRALISLAVGLLGLAASASPEPPEVRDRVRAVLARDAFQTELPLAPDSLAGSGRGRSWSRERSVAAPREPADPRGIDLGVPEGLGGALVQAFVWVVAGALLLVILLAAADAWRRRRARGYELPLEAAAVLAPAPAGGEAAGPDLEALVRAGLWAEAVHLLLQLAIGRLEHPLRRAVPPSLTGREVLRLPDVRPAVRGSLATLVEAVELSYFGGQPPAREDYRRCAEAYEQVRRET
ncbi:MAG TPA: DUF4129 domain-containing protein [Thermoanaerobaculia bacterium]|jgi:hypothetical protein